MVVVLLWLLEPLIHCNTFVTAVKPISWCLFRHWCTYIKVFSSPLYSFPLFPFFKDNVWSLYLAFYLNVLTTPPSEILDESILCAERYSLVGKEKKCLVKTCLLQKTLDSFLTRQLFKTIGTQLLLPVCKFSIEIYFNNNWE